MGQLGDGTCDSRLYARLLHREQCHSDKPRGDFLLVRANNSPAATLAVRNKGAASHVLQLKKGEAGDHVPIRVATPPTGKAKKHRMLYRVLCSKCGAYAQRLKDLAHRPAHGTCQQGPQAQAAALSPHHLHWSVQTCLLRSGIVQLRPSRSSRGSASRPSLRPSCVSTGLRQSRGRLRAFQFATCARCVVASTIAPGISVTSHV